MNIRLPRHLTRAERRPAPRSATRPCRVAFAIATSVACSLPAGAAMASGDTSGDTAGTATGDADERWIVELAEDAPTLGAVFDVVDAGAELVTVWRIGDSSGLVVDADGLTADALRALDDVVDVEPDQEYRASTEQSPAPWGLDRIDQDDGPLDDTYRYSRTGSGVTAYVVDTGLRTSHVEFAGRVPRSWFWNFGDGTGVDDCDGHGTHVAGTVGGTTSGVAKQVTIVPVKVLDCDGSGTTSSVLAGIGWIIDDHQPGVPAVVNMSLGGPPSSTLDSAVQALIDDGITVVVAAGNEQSPSCGVSPARHPAAITVSALATDDSHSWYSNYGSCSDLYAPGDAIVSAGIANDTASATSSGTSMASPHVAGAVALLLEAAPTLTPTQVWAQIEADATVGVVAEFGGTPDRLLRVDRGSTPPPPPTTGVLDVGIAASGAGSGTVTSDPAGIACTPTCAATFPIGTTVTLTATPSTSSVLTGWQGACSGSGATCQVVVGAGTASVTATFADAPAGYESLNPSRLLETRPGLSTADGTFAGLGKQPAGAIVALQVAGRGGIPADATGGVFNVTVTEPDVDGYLTVYPCGTPRPNASNVNFSAGDTVANAVISSIGAGRICVFTSSAAHLVVDAGGFLGSASPLESLAPARLLDSRVDGVTVDGGDRALGPRPGGTVTELVVAGRGGAPHDAAAVVLNVTAVDAWADGYVTAYPCGAPRPNASNVNVAAGGTVPNLVYVSVGDGGAVCLFTSSTMDLVVDLAGHLAAAGPGDTPRPPARLLETRSGLATVDGAFQSFGPRPAGSVIELQVTGRGGVPGDAATAILNVTVTETQGSGYLTVYPCGSLRPNASSLNFVAGQTIANAVLTRIGVDGKVCVFTTTATELVVDVTGSLG